MKRILFIIGFLLLLIPVRGQIINASAPYNKVQVEEGAGGSTLLDGLLSAYELDESSGNAIDEHGSVDGVVIGATQNVAGGVINTCYSFDGTDDSIRLGNNFAFVDSFSVSIWAKNSANYDFIIGNYTDYAGWRIDNSGEVARGRIYTSGADADISGSTDVVDNANFYHIVFTYDKQYVRIYVNGEQDAVAEAYSTSINYNAGSITVVGSFGDEDHHGRMDLIRLWDRALTDAEVLELYTKELAGTSYPW